MNANENLVSAYAAMNAAEAHLLKNLLDDDGVTARVTEENDPFANLPCASCHVLVAEHDLSHARDVITRFQDNLIARGEGPDWMCEDCGSIVCGAQLECGKCGASRPGFEEEGEEAI
jgi:rubrerythrin